MDFVRDDFTANTKRILAARTGHRCSNPGCPHSTIGPGSKENTIINIGVAAHITAASPGTPEKAAPRYDKTLTREQRRDISNGIWLCQNCGKLIDSDELQFPVELLKKWRKEAENRASVALTTPGATANQIATLFGELDEDDIKFLESLSLSKDDNIEALTERMRKAAQADISAFRGTRAFPQNIIELNLALNKSGEKYSVSLAGIANAIGAFPALSLVSPPGTGKSTTLVQLAGKVVDSGFAIPILLPLGEWSGTGEDFLTFFARRNAFRSFRQQHFQQVAFYGRLVLLIDGWNEVDGETRIQAGRQLDALRRDFPLASVIVGTRRQAVLTPGEIVEIELLNEDQQLEIARKFPGGSKEAVLDRAWRTPGLRELISIPLYLNALLDSTQDGSFPQTKEEVLRAFVARHEAAPDKAEILRKELFGCHNDMLIGLAVAANKLNGATISDEIARRAVSQVGERLKSGGQISSCPQPSTILDTLVNTHALVRSETGSVSFQHHQFQEWYASFEVEGLILKVAQNEAEAIKVLRAEILNWLGWEESILFACERLSRKNTAETQAVGSAIIMALGIDPMLAAEMIYRSDETVWAQIKDKVVAFANRWHKTGKVDRGLRFMMTSGRPEFAPQVWPFVANQDDQIYLSALRKPNRFRAAVLGADVVKRLRELPDKIRGDIVSAIVHESGFDGLEMGAEIAKTDSSAEVVTEIVHALEFRRADRHICQILESASDAAWEKLAAAGFPIPCVDPSHKERMDKLRAAMTAKETDPIRRIFRLTEPATNQTDVGEQITKLIEAEQFPAKSEHAAYAIQRAFEKYPTQTKAALLRRVQTGLPVPHGTDEFLKDIPAVDDGPLAAAALDRATPNAIASFTYAIIGPDTVGRLMDQIFIVHEVVQAKGAQLDEPTRKEYWRLMEAISATRQTPFVEALLKHVKSEEPLHIHLMAELMLRHGKGESSILTLTDNLRDSLAKMIEHWITILLESPKANRHQMANVAQAIARLPQPRFVAGLDKMLERDLSDWARAREDFKESRPKSPIPHDVTFSWTLQYRRAFAAIGGNEVVALMKRYLPDLQFGIDAAIVLSVIRNRENGPAKEKRWGVWNDYSDVKANRVARQDSHNPLASCDSAEAIFTVVRDLGTQNSHIATQQHAIQLATVGLRMPHASKRTEIDALMALPLPFAAKRELLTAAVEAGEIIKADDLISGINELLEAAKNATWRLDKNRGELMGWVELFPFCDRPTAVTEVLNTIPKQHCQPWDLDRLLIALADSPPTDALQILKALAERDKSILDNYHWTAAVFNLETEGAAGLIIDLICEDVLPRRNGFSEKRLAELAKQYPRIRAELLQRYASLPLGQPHSLLETVLREIADAEIVLTFVRDYARHGKTFNGNLAHAIRQTAVGRRPVTNWPNAYNEFSVSLTDLRKELFTMILANNALSALATVCLNEIEELRDEHGRVNDEPRHPDIASGQAWPKEAGED